MTLQELQAAGIQILKHGDQYFLYQQDPTGNVRRQVGSISPQAAQDFLNRYGLQATDISNIQLEQSALGRAGYDFSTGGGGFNSADEILRRYESFKANVDNKTRMQEQETMSRRVNEWIEQNKGTSGLIEPPADIQAWFQKENGTKYYIQDGVFMNEASLGNKAKEAEYEAAVRAGTMKKVPIGNGFGYIPTGSAGDLLMNNPEEYYRKYPDQRPGSPQAGAATPPAQNVQAPISKNSFTELFKNPGNDTVYGKTSDGKIVAFESGKQFTDLGLSFANVKTVSQVPTGAINFSQYASGTATPNTPTPSLDLPSDILNNEYFKALDDEGKALAAQYYKTLASGSAAEATKFSNALKTALAQADPYWKEKLRVVTDELERNLTSSDKDLAFKEAETARRIQEINDDLLYNKDQMSLEQQADLARQARAYEMDLDTVRETMAERGLSSSTIKTKTEQKLNDANSDIVESTTRKYARDQRNLGVTASRNITTYQKNLEELRRSVLESKIGNVRKVESVIGSDNLTKLPGAGGLGMGNISGTIKDEQASDILARARALLQGQLQV